MVGRDCINRYEFAMAVANEFGLESDYINPITSDKLKQVAERPIMLRLSNNKVERTTNIKMLGVKDGLRELKSQLV